MSTQKTLLTANEFFEQYGHQEGKFELVKGEVVEVKPPGEEHGEISLNIGSSFHGYSRRYGTGRAGVETGHRLESAPDTVRGPDVYFSLSRRAGGRERSPGFVPGAPDIAVEVVSPSDTAPEVERKVAEYLAAGSQRVWVVYPSGRRVAVHRADGSVAAYGGDDVITDEELLPGFSLPLADIFA